jgi:hypothetical protein
MFYLQEQDVIWISTKFGIIVYKKVLFHFILGSFPSNTGQILLYMIVIFNFVDLFEKGLLLRRILKRDIKYRLLIET